MTVMSEQYKNQFCSLNRGQGPALPSAFTFDLQAMSSSSEAAYTCLMPPSCNKNTALVQLLRACLPLSELPAPSEGGPISFISFMETAHDQKA